jgi:ribosomal protein L17
LIEIALIRNLFRCIKPEIAWKKLLSMVSSRNALRRTEYQRILEEQLPRKWDNAKNSNMLNMEI